MLKQFLNLKLSQKLSPQQIQLMKLIQLPTQAFEQRLLEEMNSEYIKSAPCCLHNLRNGGSLTSSIGARSNGKSGNSMLPILIKGLYFQC